MTLTIMKQQRDLIFKFDLMEWEAVCNDPAAPSPLACILGRASLARATKVQN
ncbi:MAG: hypothetical protein HC869_02900 [Rhodospirillales bacterium]|nr:hypothetical protein [Rhodospirillales bacterium]